jgi:hypothetical protein
MADLSRTRKRIISAIIALGVIDLGALIYLALPYRAGASQPAQVQQAAEEEFRQVSRTTVPLRGIDQKLTQAQKDDATFMATRLPSRYSDVVEELGKLAQANHIAITAVAYKTTPDKVLDLIDLEMHAGLDGQYVNVMKFMNSVERDKMFFIIDSVGLTGAHDQKAGVGEVRLDVKLDTYLRGPS